MSFAGTYLAAASAAGSAAFCSLPMEHPREAQIDDDRRDRHQDDHGEGGDDENLAALAASWAH